MSCPGDDEAYGCRVGKELPPEAAFEFAARGGLEGSIGAWDEKFVPGGRVTDGLPETAGRRQRPT